MQHSDRVYLFGASGLLGNELAAEFPRARLFGHRRAPAGGATADISNFNEIEALLAEADAHCWVVNAAGWVDADSAETPEGRAQSHAANVVGPRNLARLSARSGFRLLHFGSAYVFDGSQGDYRETDPTGPINTYGRHKLEGEQAVLAEGGVVMRTDVVYGAHGANFIDAILRLAAERDELGVVSDQTGSPTRAGDLAKMVRSVMALTDPAGLFHAANQGACSRAELAARAIAIAGLKCRVREISTSDYNASFRRDQVTALRPRDSSVNCGKLESFYANIPWDQALEAYLAARIAPANQPGIRPNPET